MIVNAATGDVPDMTVSERDEADHRRPAGATRWAQPPRTGRRGWSAPATVRLSACRPRGPEPVVSVAFWSKRPLAFNRTHVPLARRNRVPPRPRCRSRQGRQGHASSGRGPYQRVDAGVQRGVDRRRAAAHMRVVGESVEWRGVLRKATQVA